jgi:membrane protein YdbS with pleckstrin-like domain
MQIGGYAIFIGAGAFADYGAIYSGLPFTAVLSYQFVYFLFIVLAELAITIAIFLEWFLTHLEIRPDMVVFSRGALLRRKTAIPIDRVASATAAYGILGKLFGFGKLTVKGISGEGMALGFVPRPQKYAELIMRSRANERRETPSFAPTDDAERLIGQGEGEHLEFKSTMRWDMAMSQINRGLEKMVLKTVAAFLNSDGGQLVIGVDDRGRVLGLEHDMKTLTKQDADGFENHFTHVFNSAIGAEFREFVRLRFTKAGGKDVCVVSVAPAPRPAFARFDSAEEFYVRTGNSTTPLKISEATAYISRSRKRFS